MDRIKILFACLVAMFAATQRSDAQLALSLGASFPGTVYTDNGYDNYYAKLRIGFDVGAQYNFSINKYLDAIVSADFIRHGLGKMAQNQMGFEYSRYPSYLNFPLMAGVACKIDFDGQGFINPSHHAFIEVRAGANASTQTRAVFTDKNGVKQTRRYSVGFAPAFSVGAGMRFSDHGAISIRFVDIGDIRLHERGDNGSELRYSPRMVDIRYSYYF